MSLLPVDPATYQFDPMGSMPQFMPPKRKGFLGSDAVQGLLGNQDLAMALLANSGYSPQKRSLGEIFGTSAMQAREMGAQRLDDETKRKYMAAQIQQMQSGPSRSPYGAIPVERVTPESLKRFEQSGKYSDLEFRPEQKQMMDTAEMRNFQFRAGLKTPEEQRLFDDITRQNYDVVKSGGVQNVVRKGANPIVNPLNSLQNEINAAAQIKAAESEAGAMGAAAGAQGAKAPNLASFNTAASNMRRSFETAKQGMIMGPAGAVFDYGDARLFDSRKNQLSTELRAVFRIPGEGEISDREQAQYNLQLPDRSNPPEVNEAILADLEARIKDRLATPIGTTPAVPAAPPAKASAPAVGTVKGGYRFKGGNPADKNNWEPVK